MINYLKFIALFFFCFSKFVMGEDKDHKLIVSIGDSSKAARRILLEYFDKVIVGSSFSVIKDNRDVKTINANLCTQYRMTKGEQSLMFITAEKDGRITALASVRDKYVLEFDAIPWKMETKATIDLNRLEVAWTTPNAVGPESRPLSE